MGFDKKDCIEEIAREIETCKKCRLYMYAKHGVPGEGNNQTHLMLVGEAPGANEDLQGRPFVGAAGQFLEEMLADIGFARKDVYITNIVKHRPPLNRMPRKDEVEACTPYLERQVSIIRPKIIAPLGNCSTRYLLSQFGEKYKKLSEVRGKIFSGRLFDQTIKVVPTFHPAAILYDRAKIETIRKDFRLIRDSLSVRSE